MARHDDDSWDEGYYEDDGEFTDGEERSSLRHKVLAVFGTSYGISIALHAALLLILATIVIASPPLAKKAEIHIGTKPIPPAPKIDPMLDRDVEDRPQLDVPEALIPVVTDTPEITERPKGHETGLTDKDLDSPSNIVDAFGVGGGGSQAYGTPDGIRRATGIGAPPGSVNVVKAGLRWLKFHQSPDGRWDADGWRSNCSRGPTCSGPGSEDGGTHFDSGVTGLALLAFMGQGHTSSFGHFKRTVRKGLTWLVRQQRADGSIGFEPGVHGTMYNHAMATMALCEAYGLRDLRLRRAAKKAVQFCLDAQNPGLGWKYGVRDGRNDTSVTGWMVLALKAARSAGLEVPRASFTGAKSWLRRATAQSGEVGYESPGGGSSALQGNDTRFEAVPTMTAVSVVCRLFSGEARGEESMRRGARELAGSLPTLEPRKVNFYYWYYGTYALFHYDDGKWPKWNKAMLTALMPTQRKGACEDGSWDPIGEWCPAGGRVYATAINILTLEIYYRYARMSHAK